MKDKYQEQWEKLGENDPYWAVLTDPSKKGNKWSKAEFFATGTKEIEDILTKIQTLGLKVNFGTGLDFGCGVGRLSRALAGKFKQVIGVDISQTMLQEAKTVNDGLENIKFLHNTAVDLSIIPDQSIDFLYSNIVLQHMPKDRQIVYLKEFCRILKPEGVIAVQTPARTDLKTWRGWVLMLAGNRLLNILRKIKYGPSGVMEIHTVPKQTVIDLLEESGMQVVQVSSYETAGPGFESYMYIGQKS